MFISQKSTLATLDDAAAIRNLNDNLSAHLDGCVGTAANIIDVNKRMIVVPVGPMILMMVNLEAATKYDSYETEEGCLSLDGTRKTRAGRLLK